MHQSSKERIIESAGNRLLSNNLHESIQMSAFQNWLERAAEIRFTDEQKFMIFPKNQR